MAKKGRPKSEYVKTEFKFTSDEFASFKIAAEVSGISLKSWAIERLRDAAIQDIDYLQGTPFMARFFKEKTGEVAPKPAEAAKEADASQLPPAELPQMPPEGPQQVDIVKGDHISYLNKNGDLVEGKVVAELEEMQEFVVSNDSGNDIVPAGKVKAKIAGRK